ncbi:MAG: hypothetical protein ABH878_06015, partial [bacterium]
IGDWNHAEAILKKGVKQFDDYAPGFLVLGEGYFYNGDFLEAEECVRKGLQIEPSHLGLLKLMRKVKERRMDREDVERLNLKLKLLDPLYSDLAADRPSTPELDESKTIPSVPEIEVPEEPVLAEEVAEERLIAEEDRPTVETEQTQEIIATQIPLETTSEAEIVEDEIRADQPIEEPITEEPPHRIAAKEAEVSDAPVEVPQANADETVESTPPSFWKTLSQAGAELEDVEDRNSAARKEQETTAKDRASTDLPTDKRPMKLRRTPQQEQRLAEEPPPLRDDDPFGLTGYEFTDGFTEDGEPEFVQQPEPPPKRIATKTLGELYANQQKYDEAINIYETLLEGDPDNEAFRSRLEELKIRRDALLENSQNTNKT